MLDVNRPFAEGKVKLRIQSVIYTNSLSDIQRSLANLARAVEIGLESGDFASVDIAYGDCSPKPVFDENALAGLRDAYPQFGAIYYTHFQANLGSARGHNTLLKTLTADFALIMNPDIRVAPTVLRELIAPFRHPGIGETEARQLPIEHPKCFDATTGETSWAATACAMIPRTLLEELNGFDADTFFLYCDDVDFSWRVRLKGFKVIYQPSAMVFHDKRLGPDGEWLAGDAEKYYSAEAALMMAHKWSRLDLVEQYLSYFRKSDVDYLERAAAEYAKRRDENRLPLPLDPEARITQFVGTNYASHRFVF